MKLIIQKKDEIAYGWSDPSFEFLIFQFSFPIYLSHTWLSHSCLCFRGFFLNYFVEYHPCQNLLSGGWPFMSYKDVLKAGCVIVMSLLMSSCRSSPSTGKRYIYDYHSGKYFVVDHWHKKPARSMSHSRRPSRQKIKISNIQVKRSRNFKIRISEKKIGQFTQVLNNCPEGHPVDVTDFELRDRVRCPIDNSIFEVTPDVRN